MQVEEVTSFFRRQKIVKSFLQTGLERIRGCSLWTFWTAGYWGTAWLIVLGHLTSITETLCFVGSWPFCAVLLFPIGTFEESFLYCAPVCIWLFVVYWKRLLCFVTRNAASLLAGCLIHILGAVGLVRMYNQFEGGIPFRFYFWDTLAGGVMTAGYILGYGVVHGYIERRMTRMAET